jgi:glycosyltransferase involved in cell wall biosynthesis
MSFTRTAVRLVLAGRPETPEYLDQLLGTVERLDLAGKVTIIPEFITDEKKSDLFSRALACAYIPYDEDSYGYVTMEAFESRKAVVTCSDSGGIDILVRDGATGFIVPPQPQALAEAFDKLYLNRRNAQQMGESGRALMHSLGINWETVIARLTS